MTKWLLGLVGLALAIGWGLEWRRRVSETTLLQEQLRDATTQIDALNNEKRRFQQRYPVTAMPKPENKPSSPPLPVPGQSPAQTGNVLPVFPASSSGPREMPAPSGPVTMPTGNAMTTFPSPTVMPGGNSQPAAMPTTSQGPTMGEAFPPTTP